MPSADSGLLRVTRPEGSVTVTVGDGVCKQALDVAVQPPVVPIHQPSSLTCWAAGGAMMESWRTRQPLTIAAVLDALGGEWRAKFDAGAGLTVAELRAFLAALHLVEEAVQSYTPEGLANLLAGNGPLLEVGDDAVENNLVVHVRVVTAVRGDGSAAGTTVTLADPASGTSVSEPFSEFDHRHASADAAQFGVGIFHF